MRLAFCTVAQIPGQVRSLLCALMSEIGVQVTAEKQEALRLNEAMLQEHEELQAFVAQETSRHHNAEVHGLHQTVSSTHVQPTAFVTHIFNSIWLNV